MGRFGDEERNILNLMSEGTMFQLKGKEYKVKLSGKPTCQKGEPKTDVYILAESSKETIEIKISYKKENADFIENKMSAERAEQILGSDWMSIIEKSTNAIANKFYERTLIYKNQFKRTQKGAITLGWKFELLNKQSGELSGLMELTEKQVADVYAGGNLSIDKKNTFVGDKMIENSGVANYILMKEQIRSAQEVIDNLVPIEEYIRIHPEIYFACRALNYRTFEDKWDGNRPLSVQVDWNLVDGKLKPMLVFDKPLQVGGNEVGDRLKAYMRKLQIKNTDDLNDNNLETDRII